MITMLTAAPEPEPRPRVTPGRRTAHGADRVPIEAGRLAHRLIARGITTAHPDSFDVLAAARTAVNVEPRLRTVNQRRVAMIAATAAAVYLRQLRPTLATVVQTEATLSNSRPDIMFRFRSSHFFFDEVKGGRATAAAWHYVQVRRQLRDGHAEFGHDFVGVRLVFTGIPAASLLVTRFGAFPLSETPLAFDLLRRDEETGS